MSLTSKDLRRIAYSFLFAFTGSLIVNAAGIAQAKNLSEARAFVVSLLAGAVAAGLSAVKNAALDEDHPLK